MLSSGPIHPDTHLATETQLTDYTLLHQGHYSRVFTVRQGERRLLLKTLPEDCAGQREQLIALLRREYALLSTLDCPYIVRVWDFREDPVLGWAIIEEYIEAEDLQTWLQHKPSQHERKQVLNELMEALDYLHSKTIIHGDLKPDNILITRTGGHVRLIDLGFSDRDDMVNKAIGCTPSFAAPEQQQSNTTLDVSADIYALGQVLRMLFPRRYRGVSRRCMAKQPSKRYSSIQGVRIGIRNSHIRPIATVASVLLVLLSSLIWHSQTQQVVPVEPLRDTIVVVRVDTVVLPVVKPVAQAPQQPTLDLSSVHACYDSITRNCIDSLKSHGLKPSSHEGSAYVLSFGQSCIKARENAVDRDPEHIDEIMQDYINQFQRNIRYIYKCTGDTMHIY